jgi:hypothetical protein
MRRTRTLNVPRLIMATMLAAFVGGCSMDDVELNGGVFNALGIGSNQEKSAEPKLAERTPLVVPPTTARLPTPGEAPESLAVDVTASINDPDRAAVVDKNALQRQQDEYCRTNYEPARARGDSSADSMAGPLGPCRASVLTAIKKWNGEEEAE